MAKTSLYLPDDLAEQVRAHGISISEVAQAALRQAVRDAEIKENVMTDIQAVAERLQATRVTAAEADEAKAAGVRAFAVKWARTEATADELEYLATYKGDYRDYRAPLSLVIFASSENSRKHRAAGGIGLPGPSDLATGPGDRYWPDLLAGVREVWEAVQPLLIGIDEFGATVAPEEGYTEVIRPEHRLWALREPGPDAPVEEHDRWMAEEPEEFR